MSYEQPHINPWADKLQQAPLPDADASWKGMQHLLDQHLPVEKKERKRRFFFLLLPALFLLVGMALFIGYRFYASDTYSSERTKTNLALEVKDSGNVNSITNQHQSLIIPSTNNTDAAGNSIDSTLINSSAINPKENIKKRSVDTSNQQTILSNDILVSSNAATSARLKIKGNESNANAIRNEKESVIKGSTLHKSTGIVKQKGESRLTTTPAEGATMVKVKKKKQEGKNTIPPPVKSTHNIKALLQYDTLVNKKASRKQSDNDNTVFNKSDQPIGRNPLPAFRSPLYPLAQVIQKDSLGSNIVNDHIIKQLQKKTPEVIKKGWTFSVGLNHYFRINNQAQAPYAAKAKAADSEGLTGKIADYIPVPQVRYYFNNRLFVQGEVQFNAPQFAQNVVLQQNNYQQTNYRAMDTAYLKKLTYFNVPVSVHYSPLKHLSIGAGIQFSRLSNAIVLHKETRFMLSPQSTDTIKTSKVQRIKNDTLFQKLHTNEFRLLGDVSYQAGPFSIGVRYNHALRGLVKVPVAGAAISQTRNSSLQLYIRYRFLDKRKRIQPVSK